MWGEVYFRASLPPSVRMSPALMLNPTVQPSRKASSGKSSVEIKIKGKNNKEKQKKKKSRGKKSAQLNLKSRAPFPFKVARVNN